MNNSINLTLRMLIPVLLAIAVLYTLLVWQTRSPFPGRETARIQFSDSVMYVTVVSDPQDSAILRTPCAEFSDKQLRSKQFRILCRKMVSTVRSPQQDGVGIAAPQVGISRRLIVVQRFDKEGEPFEAYANVYVDSLFGPVIRGQEGCLSLPGLRGIVPRNDSVIVRHTDPETLQVLRDTVGGFTAVIFQHECDHLDGILYTDRAELVNDNPLWTQARAPFEEQGAYRKPKKW